MCGFCGFSGKNKENQIIKNMTDTLLHRGPDDSGFFCDENLSFGFRRLSIIDLKNGSQPMFDYERSVIVVFNGEIYNYKELKNELIKDGFKFKTDSDTEVICQLYKKFGINFVKELNGMYAIALYDISNYILYFISDRFLKKPLFYYINSCDNEIIFGSEIKSLLKHPSVKKELEYEAIHHYLSFKHIPRPLTAFKNIYSLEPAQILKFNLKTKIITSNKYWELDYSKYFQENDEEFLIKEYLEIFGDSVKKRLIADVDIGLYLSGGLDTSGILSIAAPIYNKKLFSFTITYPKTQSSLFNKELDRKYARFMAEKYQTEHIEICVDMSKVRDEIDDIIKCADEPFSAGGILYYYLSREVKKYCKVVLSGDGGDEQFGSYFSHLLAYPVYYFNKIKKNEMIADDSIKKILFNNFDEKYIAEIAEENEWDWRIKLNIFDEKEKNNLYSEKMIKAAKFFSTVDWYKNEFQKCKASTPLNRMLEMELKTKFSNEMTLQLDRYNMAHSVECRCPFIDYRLMQFASCIPDTLKIKNGETKYIYKRAMSKILPNEILTRPKEGGIMPLYDYLVDDWKNWAYENIIEIETDIFDVEKIKSIFKNQKKIKPYHFAQKIWNLLLLKKWIDLYF